MTKTEHLLKIYGELNCCVRHDKDPRFDLGFILSKPQKSLILKLWIGMQRLSDPILCFKSGNDYLCLLKKKLAFEPKCIIDKEGLGPMFFYKINDLLPLSILDKEETSKNKVEGPVCGRGTGERSDVEVQ